DSRSSELIVIARRLLSDSVVHHLAARHTLPQNAKITPPRMQPKDARTVVIGYCFALGSLAGVRLKYPSAHGMKYFQFGPSVCPPSCWRQASWPSSSETLTAGISSFV